MINLIMSARDDRKAVKMDRIKNKNNDVKRVEMIL